MRRAIGANMARSKRDIPHYYLQLDIDLAPALGWLQHHNDASATPEHILPVALLAHAVAHTAREYPDLNGHFIDGSLRPSQRVHLGVAIALRGGGLVAPAIHDADQLTVPELMHALLDLTTRARTGGLRGAELTDGTLTLTSLGDQGVDLVHGVIYPPQVALVGMGRVRPLPWAEGGAVIVRPILTATLAADHRASDGHQGGRFLGDIARHLARPGAP